MRSSSLPLAGSAEHAQAARAAAGWFSEATVVDGVLLVGSWARGRAHRGSDLDLAVLVTPDADEGERDTLLAAWEQSKARVEAGKLLQPLVRHSDFDVEVLDGEFAPEPRGWTSGPDEFELQIGNHLAYSTPLFERGDRYRELRNHWLPFYDDELRARRLDAVRTYCSNDLGHIPCALGRGDRLHAFHRLYHASQEFLQALFITRRTYPISYDKWIEDQLVGLLGLPELYKQLLEIVGVAALDPAAISASGARLGGLLDEWTAG
jgi:nucleotidyltransferase-like protein